MTGNLQVLALCQGHGKQAGCLGAVSPAGSGCIAPARRLSMDGMIRNTALVAARTRAGLSQDGLARRIQEVGHRLGHPNGCNRANVHRWESGGQPQARYVLILEAVLNAPASELGIFTDIYEMDRDRMLAESGLDASLAIPEPSARYGYGPLTGIWLSRYQYPSSSRGTVLSSSHYCMVLQRGAHLNVRSLPKQASRLALDLSLNGQIARGTWTEHTDPNGYYSGAVYDGAILLRLDPTGRRLAGKWLGYGRDGETNDGPWSFTLVSDQVTADSIAEWDRAPEAAGNVPDQE